MPKSPALLILAVVLLLGGNSSAYAFSPGSSVGKRTSHANEYMLRIGASEEINKRVHPRHRCRYYYRYGSLRRYCER
jgi:hypothetical protein